MQSKKVAILAFIFLNFFRLHANWDPKYCLLEPEYCLEDPIFLAELTAPPFISLKSKVIQSLAGSWCSEEKANLLMNLIVATKPDICVEIGAFTGSSVLPIATALKYVNHGKIYAIDTWSNFETIKYLDNDDPNKSWWSTVNMEDAYHSFHQKIWEWALYNYCIVIRSPSEKTAQKIDSIDFLHIDGDYSEKGSVQDISLYLPRVKNGGYILMSNIYIMVKNKQPKAKALSMLMDSCELICGIENDHAMLFRKKSDRN